MQHMQANDHDMRSKDCNDVAPIDGIKMCCGKLNFFCRKVHIVFLANGRKYFHHLGEQYHKCRLLPKCAGQKGASVTLGTTKISVVHTNGSKARETLLMAVPSAP